ncbi:MAG: DUF2163 domain-containing protein [Alphaproteobacteria bacterium]|jgi:uncharacterized phage protein (TIGR02218 family)|nr:DUF2163 domain-containing protein [Alphaproteobacteria bacterium]
MRTASSNLTAHLAGEVTSLAICWKLTLVGGTVMGFTDHTSDLTISSQLYKAATGFSPTSIETKDRFSVDNLDVAGILDSAAITEADIMAGKYDFAEIEIFMVNVTDLAQGIITHRRGWLGEVSVKNGQFVAEVRGLAQKFQQNIGELYSPTCRAVFGDTRCKINLASYTASGAINTVTSRQVFISNAMTQAAGYFSGGEMVWLTGANAGRQMEIKEFSNKQFTLVLPMPNSVAVGDTFNAIAGCDKTFNTCFTKFANAVNFRGEPHVPGMDKVLATAATANDLQHS